MNIKPIKKIAIEELKIKTLEEIVNKAFKNTNLNQDVIVGVMDKVICENDDYFLDVNNNLSDETEGMSVSKKIDYMLKKPKKHNILIHFANEMTIEDDNIETILEDYNLELEDFKVKEDISKLDLYEYNNLSEYEKEDAFWDINEYRGVCENIFSKKFYADDEGVNFGDASDKMLCILMHINSKKEIEFYGCSMEYWGMGGGYRLIEDVGSFENDITKFINDITNSNNQ